MQNVHTSSLIPPKCAYKCAYKFFHYAALCSVPGNAWWQFHNKSLCCSYKSLFKSFVEMHKTWPNQHNMTKLQSNMANVHFFPSMSMGFTNCSSGLNLTRTIVGLPDLSGSPHIHPLLGKFPQFAQNSKEQYWSVAIIAIKKLTKLNQRSFKNFRNNT